MLRSLTLVFVGLAAGFCASAAAAEQDAPRYSNHHDLSYYLQSDGTREAIRSTADWQQRRRHILAGIEEAMGPLPRPEKPVPLDVEIVEEHRDDGLIRRKLAYHTDRRDYKVRAWLLIPKSVAAPSGAGSKPAEPNSAAGFSDTGPARHSAVLCLHQTTPNGKDSPAGLSDRPTMHYALELARRGYVTLAPDYPSLGEHDYDFDADDYASGSMKAIYDNIRAIDLLQSLPEVDPQRIGCIGHSLGGHNALFTAVFEERIQAVVTSCGFTSFHRYMGGDLRGWSGSRYMPRIATRYNFDPDQMPFDFPEILAAIAPRAVFIVAPLHDDNFDVTGVRDCVKAAQPIYALLGESDHLQATYPGAAHDFPSTEREAAYALLDNILNTSR